MPSKITHSPLDYPVTLTFEQVVKLTMILTDYRNEVAQVPITDELAIYRYMLARRLIKQLRSKSVTMDHMGKRLAKITFSVDQVQLIHRVLREMNYGPQWQPILNAFDQAQVSLIPVTPPAE